MRMSWTWLPNFISLLRLALGVVFPWFAPAWRLPVIVAAAITDGLDGQASRWLGAESRAGKILDPVADKVFFGMVCLTLMLDGTLGIGEFLLIGLRDVMVLAGGVIAVAQDGGAAWKHMPPRLLGKLATALQFVFLAALLLELEAARPWLLAAAALVSGAAGIDYILAYRRARK
jgi:phosphatidylglycerophosphate synthase